MDIHEQTLVLMLQNGWKMQRTSCSDGGQWAWMEPDEGGGHIMFGCVCHSTLSAMNAFLSLEDDLSFPRMFCEVLEFTVWETGGGCEAYGLKLDNGDSDYLLVTSAMDGSYLPGKNDKYVMLGHYKGPDNEECDCWIIPAVLLSTRVKQIQEEYQIEEEKKWTHKLNSRVVRFGRLGRVTRRYCKPQHEVGGLKLGPYPELYEVIWDDGKLEKGFLPHGITKI